MRAERIQLFSASPPGDALSCGSAERDGGDAPSDRAVRFAEIGEPRDRADAGERRDAAAGAVVARADSPGVPRSAVGLEPVASGAERR